MEEKKPGATRLSFVMLIGGILILGAIVIYSMILTPKVDMSKESLGALIALIVLFAERYKV